MPYTIEVKAGQEYWLCVCGLSGTGLCNGGDWISNSKVAFDPVFQKMLTYKQDFGSKRFVLVKCKSKLLSSGRRCRTNLYVLCGDATICVGGTGDGNVFADVEVFYTTTNTFLDGRGICNENYFGTTSLDADGQTSSIPGKDLTTCKSPTHYSPTCYTCTLSKIATS